ncbi:ABC transporter ATP-binding protein [Natronorubrum sp. DTA7]|uniref:ABC transporter ATP-binding protein n=1 Tax=Natronorubrum sp. DTA7 TaxID=3447016 RepID=UPI003F87D43D
MSSEPLLRVENLKTQFFTETGTVRAVDGISFEVNEGEIVGLVGESGAGKSVASMSLLRLIEEPGEIVGGEITYKGETIFGLEEGPDGELRERDDMLSKSEMRERIRGREIAVIFQDPMESLNPVFTVGGQLREFIEINRDLSKDEAKVEAIRMLREVGIPDPEDRYEEYPHQFSGGMRQRVLIAMALACEPNLIIADEPTTALDVTVEGQILDLVDDLQDRYDTSFIWVTHDMGVVAEICDRVNVMYLGEIIEQAPVDELFYDTKHPYTDALLDSMPRPDRTVDELDPIEGVMPEAINPPSGCRFHPRCPDAREVCTRVHPETLEIDRADGHPHRAACVKHDVFDVGYEESAPLEAGDEAETRIGETGTEENASAESAVEEEQASTDGGRTQGRDSSGGGDSQR